MVNSKSPHVVIHQICCALSLLLTLPDTCDPGLTLKKVLFFNVEKASLNENKQH